MAIKCLVMKSYSLHASCPSSDSVAAFIGVIGGWSPASWPFLGRWIPARRISEACWPQSALFTCCCNAALCKNYHNITSRFHLKIKLVTCHKMKTLEKQKELRIYIATNNYVYTFWHQNMEQSTLWHCISIITAIFQEQAQNLSFVLVQSIKL